MLFLSVFSRVFLIYASETFNLSLSLKNDHDSLEFNVLSGRSPLNKPRNYIVEYAKDLCNKWERESPMTSFYDNLLESVPEELGKMYLIVPSDESFEKIKSIKIVYTNGKRSLYKLKYDCKNKKISSESANKIDMPEAADEQPSLLEKVDLNDNEEVLKSISEKPISKIISNPENKDSNLGIIDFNSSLDGNSEEYQYSPREFLNSRHCSFFVSILQMLSVVSPLIHSIISPQSAPSNLLETYLKKIYRRMFIGSGSSFTGKSTLTDLSRSLLKHITHWWPKWNHSQMELDPFECWAKFIPAISESNKIVNSLLHIQMIYNFKNFEGVQEERYLWKNHLNLIIPQKLSDSNVISIQQLILYNNGRLLLNSGEAIRLRTVEFGRLPPFLMIRLDPSGSSTCTSPNRKIFVDNELELIQKDNSIHKYELVAVILKRMEGFISYVKHDHHWLKHNDSDFYILNNNMKTGIFHLENYFDINSSGLALEEPYLMMYKRGSSQSDHVEKSKEGIAE